MTGFLELLVAGLNTGLVVGLAALAVTLVFGVARFANATTGDAMSLGAYAAFAGTNVTGSLIAGSAIGVAAGALVGAASYLLVFRRLVGRSAVTALLASIGIGLLIRAAIGLAFGRPWRIFDIRIHPNDLNLALVAVLALAVTFFALHGTPVGRRMRAVADDLSLARVSGIAPARVMIALWLLAGAVTSVAGIMLGIKAVITPEMGWEMLLPAFAAAILGGIGHPVGAVVAGILLGTVQEMSTPFVGFTYKIAISFLVLLLVLLLRPQGLFGRVEGAR